MTLTSCPKSEKRLVSALTQIGAAEIDPLIPQNTTGAPPPFLSPPPHLPSLLGGGQPTQKAAVIQREWYASVLGEWPAQTP